MFCEVKEKTLTIAVSTDGVLWSERKDWLLLSRLTVFCEVKEKTLTIAVSTDGVLWSERKDFDYCCLDWRCFVKWKKRLWLLLSRLTVFCEVKEKTLTIAISTDGVLWSERKDFDYCYLDWRCFVTWKGKSLTIAVSTDGVLWSEKKTEKKTLTIAVSTDGVLCSERKDFDYCYPDWRCFEAKKKSLTTAVSTDGVLWSERKDFDYCYPDWRCFVKWKKRLWLLLSRLTVLCDVKGKSLTIAVSTDGVLWSERKDFDYCYPDWRCFVTWKESRWLLLYRLTVFWDWKKRRWLAASTDGVLRLKKKKKKKTLTIAISTDGVSWGERQD